MDLLEEICREFEKKAQEMEMEKAKGKQTLPEDSKEGEAAESITGEKPAECPKLGKYRSRLSEERNAEESKKKEEEESKLIAPSNEELESVTLPVVQKVVPLTPQPTLRKLNFAPNRIAPLVIGVI